MMKHMKIIAITFMLLFAMTQLSAGESIFMSVAKYQDLKKSSPEKIDTYLSGALAGFTLTNAMLENNKQKKLYCIPDSKTINTKDLRSIIDLAIGVSVEANIKDVSKRDVAAFSLWVLIDVYPCK